MDSTFFYTIYIGVPVDKVWDSFVNPDLTSIWWEVRNTSDWTAGSTWQHVHIDGRDLGSGEVLAVTTHQSLEMTFPAGGATHLTITFEGHGETTRLSIQHNEFSSHGAFDVAARVWPAILSNLKTYLETDKPMPSSPLRIIGI